MKIYKRIKTLLNRLFHLYDIHPYLFSLTLSLLIISYFLFSVPSVKTAEDDFLYDDDMIIVDIDNVKLFRRVAKLDYSLDEGTVSSNIQNIERAVGLSDDANAVDIAFLPNIAPPRLIGRLKKRYPKIGEKMEVEALINTELLIDAEGFVKHVNILGIRLSKSLPARVNDKVEKAFMREAVIALKGARFSPPVIDGKNVPIKMEMPIKFRLE